MKRASRAISCFIIAISAAVFLCGCSLFGKSPTPPTPVHLISEDEAESAPVRKIDERPSASVVGETYIKRQESLLKAVTDGCRPEFGEDGADVKEIYETALKVLNRYILNDFTEYERVHAIHDWLCSAVEYDEVLYRKYLDGETVLGENDSFHLSGVFLQNRAVCDGISKAFTFLCAIEGIESSRIVGEYYDENGAAAHAWNKVRLDGNWYNVDATLDSSRITVNGKTQTLVHHGFFCLSDEAMENETFGRHYAIKDIEFNPVNEKTPKESYPVYENLKIRIGDEQFDALVTSQQQLNEMFVAVRKSSRKVGKLDIKLKIEDVAPNVLGAYDRYIERALENVKNTDFEFTPVLSVRPYIQYPDGAMLFLIYA